MKAILIRQDGQKTEVEITLHQPMGRNKLIDEIKRNMNGCGLVNKVVNVKLK